MHTGENLAGPGSAGLDAGQLRLLALAGLASLALHALLLYALPILERAIKAPAAPRLTAHLAKPPPEPPVAAPALPTPRPAPAAAAPRRAVAPPVAESKPVAAPPPSDFRPIAEVAPAGSGAVPAPAQQSATVGAETAPAAASASAGPDPGSVARFRLELMDAARRHKRYPRVAQDNGWEGRVELRIAFAENGVMSSLTVKKGTGRAALDDAAQAMIRGAQAQTPVPPALRGRAFTLDIPVDFSLKD